MSLRKDFQSNSISFVSRTFRKIISSTIPDKYSYLYMFLNQNQMKMKLMFTLTIVFTMVFGGIYPAFSNSNEITGDTLIRVAVKVNDTILQDSLYLLNSTAGTQVEVKHFMQLIGGSFYPFSHIFHQDGMMVQYGRFISFSRLNFTEGFVNLKMVPTEPPVSTWLIGTEHVYFAPLAFLGLATGGTVSYDAIGGILDITVPPPMEFGSIFPAARDVATALQDSGYIVQQGEITQESLIDFCLAGYTPNANGNNVGVPYLGMQLPPPPGMDSLLAIPLTYNVNSDEAVVLIGKTPPECKYYSYRSYLENRLYNFPPSTTRTKINASLGDMTSLYRMRPDLPLDSMFGRKIALIMAGDSLVANRVKHTILASTPEIAPEDIYFDIIPSAGMFIFGTGPMADWLNFAHRISLVTDTAAERIYINNPPLEILRITPMEAQPQALFALRSFLPRTCGTNEYTLLSDVELMEEGIDNMYHTDYEMIWLKPSPWVIEGFGAIQQGMDALGDNHDALYITTSEFQFRENDMVLVYGVDHTLTGKSVYNNVTIYDSKYMAGYGGITNTMMEKSARQFVADTIIADQLYAYLFSRHPVPGNPYVYIVPSDTNGTMEGINVNDTAEMGFRLYVNTITKIGPDPMEVILDQAVLLRPFNSGIDENSNGNRYPDMKVYPNPVTYKATLEFSVTDWSDISLTVYNSSGQQTGTTLRIDHVKGIVRQELRLSGSMPSGIYYIQGVVTGKEKSINQTMNARMLWLGGTGQ